MQTQNTNENYKKNCYLFSIAVILTPPLQRIIIIYHMLDQDKALPLVGVKFIYQYLVVDKTTAFLTMV